MDLSLVGFVRVLYVSKFKWVSLQFFEMTVKQKQSNNGSSSTEPDYSTKDFHCKKSV